MSKVSIKTVYHLNGVTDLRVQDDSSLREHYYDRGDTRIFGITAEGRFVYRLTGEYAQKWPHMQEASHYRWYSSIEPEKLSPAEFCFLRELFSAHRGVVSLHRMQKLTKPYMELKSQMFFALGGGGPNKNLAEQFTRGIRDAEWQRANPPKEPELTAEEVRKLGGVNGFFEQMLMKALGLDYVKIRRTPPNVQEIPKALYGEQTLRQMHKQSYKVMGGNWDMAALFKGVGDVEMLTHDTMSVLLREGVAVHDAMEKLIEYSEADAKATAAWGALHPSEDLPAHADHTILVGDAPEARERYNKLVAVIKDRLAGDKTVYDTNVKGGSLLHLPSLTDESEQDILWPELKELKLIGKFHARQGHGGPSSSFVSFEFKDDPAHLMGSEFFIDVDICGFSTSTLSAARLVYESLDRLTKVKVKR